jgi:hypothetical protein
MDKRLYFYSPGDNFYDAPITLFVVAKHSVRDNSIRWLEPSWTAGEVPELNGLTVFTSKLDAFIFAMMLNECDNEGWSVYPFADISVTEMMIDVAPTQKNYTIHMTFGFSVDDDKNILRPNRSLITKGYAELFIIENGLSALSPIIMRFNKDYFKQIDEEWNIHYKSYCEEIKSQNEKSNEEILAIAKEAMLKIKITRKFKPGDFGQISHYSPSKKEWIVSY